MCFCTEGSTWIRQWINRSLHGVMVKALDCSFEVSEFQLQLVYYIHFQINTLGKVINCFIPPALG